MEKPNLMKMKLDRTVMFRFLLMLLGVMAGGTAVVMIKASDESPLLVASYRLLVAALALTPFFVRDLTRFDGKYGWTQLSWAVLPALALAFHFMTWVVGARMTQTSNAVLIANLTPVAMPFFVWIFFKERVNRQEIVGTLLALAGLIWMTGATLMVSKSDFMGDVICFISMLGYAMYMALGRRNGGRISLWLYMVPLYYIAGLVCLGCALFTINPIKPYTLTNLLLILGLGLIPTVFGHTILNYSLKFFRGQVVSVTNLAQILSGTLLGYLFLNDIPQPSFYGASVLILIGILIVLNASRYHQIKNPDPLVDHKRPDAGPD
jgi:drug/metabolite transporter (DMT)-like permease